MFAFFGRRLIFKRPLSQSFRIVQRMARSFYPSPFRISRLASALGFISRSYGIRRRFFFLGSIRSGLFATRCAAMADSNSSRRAVAVLPCLSGIRDQWLEDFERLHRALEADRPRGHSMLFCRLRHGWFGRGCRPTDESIFLFVQALGSCIGARPSASSS